MHSDPQRALRIFRQAAHLRIAPDRPRQSDSYFREARRPAGRVVDCIQAGLRPAPECAAAIFQKRSNMGRLRFASWPDDDHPIPARSWKIRAEPHQALGRSEPVISVPADQHLIDSAMRQSRALGLVRKPVAVKSGEPFRGGEPQKAARIRCNTVNRVVRQAVGDSVTAERKLCAREEPAGREQSQREHPPPPCGDAHLRI